MREATATAGADVYIPGIGPVRAGSELGVTVNEQGWVQVHYPIGGQRWAHSAWYRPDAMDFLHIELNEEGTRT